VITLVHAYHAQIQMSHLFHPKRYFDIEYYSLPLVVAHCTSQNGGLGFLCLCRGGKHVLDDFFCRRVVTESMSVIKSNHASSIVIIKQNTKSVKCSASKD